MIECVKGSERALTLDEVQSACKVDVADIMDQLKANSKLTFNEAANTVEYRPTYAVKNRQDLFDLVRDHWMSHSGGVHCRDLKDSWRGIPDAVEELERDNEIVVTRSV